MEWVLRSPQIHSTFSNLGFSYSDGYHVNENCNAALDTILHNILTEDKYLRSYRRNISFGQNIQKDLIPLLIHAKEDRTIELIIKILVNLTIPIECLLSVDAISKSDFGRHTIFEINNLLTTTKAAFTDYRATRVIVEFLKKNADVEHNLKLSQEQCTNISNCLLLLRNILHIPEETVNKNYNGSSHSGQNQILWNIFSQSVDKILIKLMTISDANNWAVTMVQLIALLYKDQHVVTLHKLLNLWLEASMSESSEDNESNTSPPEGAGSDDSSPMLTDQTSDSSDTGGSGKCANEVNESWEVISLQNNTKNGNQPFKLPQQISEVTDNKTSNDKNNENESVLTGANGNTNETGQTKSIKKTISDNSDCGYGTQIENQESISTSSNDDERPTTKPVHQKPHNPKQRANTKVRLGTLQERKRKKVAKRGKTNIINVQGLSHKTPTDDDISSILKEFTVDFLLKGYNSLVHTLHSEILTNLQLEIDTSHFFWLVTYFLKFATQIELGLENVCSVLSYDVMSYLTAEGVNLCERFELAIKLDGNDLTSSTRRLHLVVTAIREFVQAIQMYKKFAHLNNDDHQRLIDLQIKMCETEEVRSLLVLLLRCYDPKYHSKQYLQDLIVTNHILLIFLDNVMTLPNYTCSTNMVDHLQQFATTEIMYKYGLLLEDYASNGQFVNDCIFTMMHHVVSSEVGRVIALFQPKVLQTFTTIWKSEFEICDDWSDMIEYVMNTFIKKPNSFDSSANICFGMETFDEEKVFAIPFEKKQEAKEAETNKKSRSNLSDTSKEKWSDDELSSLNWMYMQCKAMPDYISEIIKLLKEDGIVKSRDSVIRELFQQNVINKAEFDNFLKSDSDLSNINSQGNKETRDDEIGKLCEQLTQDGQSKFLEWLQKVLLETCYAKLYFAKNNKKAYSDSKLLNFELFKKKCDTVPVMSTVSYHCLLFNHSVPLVPWNCNQAEICKDLKFLQLLHKLGFHMPVDSGKVFIRIPNFWTADFLYDVANKILPVQPSKLKFSIEELSVTSIAKFKPEDTLAVTPDTSKAINILDPSENLYQVQKQKQATMINYTPMPGSSFNIEEKKIDQNWLNVVKKSQDYNLNLNLDKIIETKDLDEDVEMSTTGIDHPASDTISKAGSSGAMAVQLNTASFITVPPTVMSVKDDTPQHAQLTDPEFCNHSVSETASVASDLTRMYVSDEDEKPEIIKRPSADITE